MGSVKLVMSELKGSLCKIGDERAARVLLRK